MAASKYDFSIEQGTSFTLSIKYKDNTGTPIDITGWCARITLTTDKNTSVIFTTDNLDLSQYNFTIDGPSGTLTLMLPADTTNNFIFNIANYDYELASPEEIYSGGGRNVYRILYGTINIIPRYSLTSNILDCING